MRAWRDWSVRTRLTLLAGILMTVLCAGISTLILTSVHAHLTTQHYRRSHDASIRAVRLLARDQLPQVIDDRAIAALQVIDPTGRIVAASQGIRGGPRMASFVPPRDSLGREETLCRVPGFGDRCMIVTVQAVPRRDGDWLVYGANPALPWYVNGQLLTGVLAGSALLIGVTAIGAQRTVGSSLKPVDDIRAKLSKITSTELGHRVPVPAPHDEIHDLARSVNETLDLLEAALLRERRFASDASHDLRSPITAMHIQMEEALLHPQETDWPATAESVLGSLERLQGIVTDLLTLCRLDAGAGTVGGPVELGELVSGELTGRPRAVNVVADLQPSLVSGDRLQLIRLLTNLLDNAERHAASTVTVSLHSENGCAVLAVTDDGPGIPADQRDRVFQRFTRLDAARDKDAGGTGLGLPIARQIAEHHGGTLTIEDSGQGARFVVRIPLRHPTG
jgi:signal transduction histidine kinase